jgi:hypothetical protein|eukprot:CAMPEP_0168316158 /NCGR_PEP_ID=MMETSP0210-20121227/14638_1 /TAXON_ID=40633 /ORGANISM="Condylostoma magnum, Strain COL2" /LENGTH=50 /DNA_ID=CAMNT_0008295389 /DNA_START=466 /DNA_END=618 /DNA_ORIENTATION=-
MTIISKQKGWVTVSKDDRSKIGDEGPLSRLNRNKRLHDVSDLSPMWMIGN